MLRWIACVVCDVCGLDMAADARMESATDARRAAMLAGWDQPGDDTDMCAGCRGDVARDAAAD